MNSPFDPTEPFGMFIHKIEDSVDLSEASGVPYTIEQIVQKDCNAVFKTQWHTDGVR